MLYIKSIFVALIILALSFANCAAKKEQQNTISGKVIKIRDGDTIEILYEGKPLAIRFAHVDCPERKQPFGNVAKQLTADLCFGKMVTIQNQNEYDRYGRLIGVVINNDKDTVNLELVKKGLAWHYKKYSADKLYAETEIEARVKKIGLWADPKPIAPWDWR